MCHKGAWHGKHAPRSEDKCQGEHGKHQVKEDLELIQTHNTSKESMIQDVKLSAPVKRIF